MEKQKLKNTARWNTTQFIVAWIFGQIGAVILTVLLSLGFAIVGGFIIEATIGLIPWHLTPLISVVMAIYLSVLVQRWAMVKYSGLTIRGWAWQTMLGTIIGIVWGFFSWINLPYTPNVTEERLILLGMIVLPTIFLISGIQYRLLHPYIGRKSLTYIVYNTLGIFIVIGLTMYIALMVIPFLIVHLLVQGLMMKRTLDAVHEDNLAVEFSQ
ncbi:MAG: hypothetical protein AAF846_23670 [Chloroflexota bacterium]